MRKPNQQTFIVFSSEHSMPNPLPQIQPHLKLKATIQKLSTLNVPEQITKKPFLTGNKSEGDNVFP